MSRYVVDRGLIGQVWQHLKARDERPRPQVEGRPNLKITAHDDAPTDVLLYDEIGFWGIMAADVAGVLADLKGDLHVRVNSPGGDVFDGIAIFNMLADWDGNVSVTVDGLAASAASFIAQAGDSVRMNRASQLMIHDASGLCIGNESDMTEMAGLLNRVSGTIAGIYADRAGGTVEDWRDRMRAETWYNAAEAVEAGLADEVAPARRARGADTDEPDEDPDEAPEEIAARVTFDLTCFQFAGRDKAPAPVQVPRNTAVGPHEGTAKEGTWDKGKEVGRLPSPMPVATARKVYALYDGDRVEDGKIVKDACSLPHHFVSEDGTPGAPSLNGVNNALSRLNQTQGYSEEERATAERHLRSHLPKSEEDHAPGWAADHTHEPAPAAEPADDEARLALVRDLVDELEDGEAAARIRSAVDPPSEPPAPPAPAAADDKPDDVWADAIAHLTDDPGTGDWGASLAHLTEPAPSSAATEA